jgi:hypothetical protein
MFCVFYVISFCEPNMFAYTQHAVAMPAARRRCALFGKGHHRRGQKCSLEYFLLVGREDARGATNPERMYSYDAGMSLHDDQADDIAMDARCILTNESFLIMS